MYCAMTNSCLSLAEGSAKISGRLLEAWDFFWEAVPLRWQSKPIFPGSWNLWSWGPKGPITSSGHTVLGPARDLVSVSTSQKKKQENPRENPSPTHRFDPKHQRCTKSEKSHFQIPTAHGFKGNKSAFPYINQEVQQPREAHLSQRNLLWKKPWDSQLF